MNIEHVEGKKLREKQRVTPPNERCMEEEQLGGIVREQILLERLKKKKEIVENHERSSPESKKEGLGETTGSVHKRKTDNVI